MDVINLLAQLATIAFTLVTIWLLRHKFPFEIKQLRSTTNKTDMEAEGEWIGNFQKYRNEIIAQDASNTEMKFQVDKQDQEIKDLQKAVNDITESCRKVTIENQVLREVLIANNLLTPEIETKIKARLADGQIANQTLDRSNPEPVKKS